MTVPTIEGVLGCDHDCGATRMTKPGQSVEDLRSQLREVGWLSVDEVDVCPRCRPKADAL